YQGDVGQAVDDVLTEVEARLTWRPQRELSVFDRLLKVGKALLCLKEIEFLGVPQEGEVPERLERLIDHLVVPLEEEYLDGRREDSVVARVKKLRIAILPDMVAGELSDEESERRWRQLADLYLAQQLAWYPADYVRSRPTVDRIRETIERFEEDVTDQVRAHRPLHCVVQIDEAIEVSPKRQRGKDGDPLMQRIEERLGGMLDELAEESQVVPNPF
ncbi:MAG: hypothetical protein N2C14_05260, partial [Planctomycetales bacterium]